MKLKSDNTDKIKKLKENIEEIHLDLIAISDEHDRYVLSDSEDSMSWMYAFPIESLYELQNYIRLKPRLKYSLRDIVHKIALKKLHLKKKEELESKTIEFNIVNIDNIISNIERIVI